MKVTPCFPKDILPEGRLISDDMVLFPNIAPYDGMSAVATMGGRHYIPMTEFAAKHITAAFQLWANVADVTFTEVFDDDVSSFNGDIRFSAYDASLVGRIESGHAYFPGTDSWSADIWLDNQDYTPAADVSVLVACVIVPSTVTTVAVNASDHISNLFVAPWFSV